MLNQISIVGHVGKDAELRYTPTGKAVLSFNLAYSKYFKNRDGEKDQKTAWFTCRIWGERAEKLHSYINKGTHLFVSGEPKAEAYINDKKEAVAYMSLTVFNFQFLDKKSDDDAIIEAEAKSIAEEAEAEFTGLVSLD